MTLKAFSDLLRTGARDRSGVAAIEFAIIAPVMVLIFFGTAELSLGISSNRKVTLSARTISDLVARTGNINKDELKNVFTAAAYIMKPYDTKSFAATVSAIDIDAQGVASVAWQVNLTWNGSSATIVDASNPNAGTVPQDLKIPKTQLIKSEVTYSYEPASAFFIKSLPMSETFYARPRMESGKVCYPTVCT